MTEIIIWIDELLLFRNKNDMKHLNKRFRFERFLSLEEENLLKSNSVSFDKKDGHKIKMPNGFKAIIATTTGKYFEAFQHNIGGKQYFVPEPDPVLIYFNNAYFSFRGLESSKEKLIKALQLETMDESVKNELYSFFGNSFGFATMLFTSIEAYINKSIPDDYEFRDVKTSKTEIFNKTQIERYLPFEIKTKNILKEIKNKDFAHAHPKKYQHIINLKEFRDSIIHTKTHKGGNTPYDYLYKKALNFKYQETIEVVKLWLNYYEASDYIEDCDCDKDF